jgi:hypothetical protein
MIQTNDKGQIVHDSLTLIPAYGRQPQTIKEATTSFLNGQDWQLVHLGSSTYCSIRDFAPGTWVTLRFRSLRSVTHCKVPAELVKPTNRSMVVEALENPPVIFNDPKHPLNQEGGEA